MDNLNRILREKTLTLSIINLVEKIDGKTEKQLCRQCGGKGFYIHNWADFDTKKIYKSEKVSCLVCEGGFIYGDRTRC